LSSELSTDLRKLVIERAKNRCEYCLLPQSVSLHKHEPDHIVPLQHGGKTDANNLTLSCMRCNRYKGPNVGSFDPETGNLVPFFNPRIQDWGNHFELDGSIIRPRTAEARVTVKIFRMNDEDRVLERQLLIEASLFGNLDHD
jgi:hypothetical protein